MEPCRNNLSLPTFRGWYKYSNSSHKYALWLRFAKYRGAKRISTKRSDWTVKNTHYSKVIWFDCTPIYSSRWHEYPELTLTQFTLQIVWIRDLRHVRVSFLSELWKKSRSIELWYVIRFPSIASYCGWFAPITRPGRLVFSGSLMSSELYPTISQEHGPCVCP